MHLKERYSIFYPIFLIMLGVITTVYFVNNPGGSMAARLLNYDEILRALRQHILLVIFAMISAILFSVPIGIIITRSKFQSIVPIIDKITNISHKVPSLAVLALIYSFFGLGFKTALFALWLYSLLPILRNNLAVIHSIPDEIIEAAKGMGMSQKHIIMRIELPLALPVIMAGIRVSVVVCAGAAALATFIGAGGLGDLIVTGLALSRNTIILTGGILTALFGILMDSIFAIMENHLLGRNQLKKVN